MPASIPEIRGTFRVTNTSYPAEPWPTLCVMIDRRYDDGQYQVYKRTRHLVGNIPDKKVAEILAQLLEQIAHDLILARQRPQKIASSSTEK